MKDVSYSYAERKFQALAGLESLTVADKFFLQNSFSRSALNAYHESNLWPRFLRVGQERALSSVSIVPYVEQNKDEIGEFIRIHRQSPYGTIGTYEYEFYLDENGANVINLEQGVTGVYVTYKKVYDPSFTEGSNDIPQEFLDYMLFTALGDFYTGDGQTENAAVAYNRADDSLSSELFRMEQKNNRNIMGIKIATHHTRQLR